MPPLRQTRKALLFRSYHRHPFHLRITYTGLYNASFRCCIRLFAGAVGGTENVQDHIPCSPCNLCNTHHHTTFCYKHTFRVWFASLFAPAIRRTRRRITRRRRRGSSWGGVARTSRPACPSWAGGRSSSLVETMAESGPSPPKAASPPHGGLRMRSVRTAYA